jgi:hypothetical protein
MGFGIKSFPSCVPGAATGSGFSATVGYREMQRSWFRKKAHFGPMSTA